MAVEYSHEHGISIHEGPMADSRGTQWREDAAKLEALNQRRIQNPEQTLPNSLTSIDKALATHAKSDEGSVDKTASGVGGDHIHSRG